MSKFTYLNNVHPEYIEQLFRQYQNDPESVDKSWQAFFQGFEFSRTSRDGEPEGGAARKEIDVLNLINAYRTRGHLFTKTNPVRTRRKYRPTLAMENFNLSEEDLDTVFQAGVELGLGPAPLRKIIEHLDETYCTSIGAEYMFIRIPERVRWLQDRMEKNRNRPDFPIEKKRQILHKLNQAVVFENFLHTRYVGQKRFSLQGGETLIPGLDAVIDKGALLGIEEFMIGMPHRGRLNVLANILNKGYDEIFSEFEGEAFADAIFAGDVKYHLGFSSEIETSKGQQVQIGVAPNPSHLEAVDPVVEGMVRAKIDTKYQGRRDKILPILVHGDAAIAGQGVVYEVIQMSLLNGYSTGGTIHLVVNNQLGFTTNYLEGRSSTYCTDVAKVTLSPVFHVNADDAEAVVNAIEMAVEYRQKFQTDVFIDLLGYRKYGHNEGDEPRFTQPKLYDIIAKHPDPRQIYNDKLLKGGSVEEGMAKQMEKEFKKMLQEALKEAKSQKVDPKEKKTYLDTCDSKKRFSRNSFDPKPKTAVQKKILSKIADNVFTIPNDFKPFRKMEKLYEDRLEKFREGKALDWAIAEFLAYGSLLREGVPIRLTGQDTERGTFSHRHSVVLSEDAEERYVPLNHVAQEQATFHVYNSPLSEYGVMGYEYGYACARPEGLTIWEAQFGDFNNGGQVVIDQFISSSETKWNRTNGLVLFLPHGYEGQGPEHSSARLERFLELAANQNMRICNCTSPANFFHLLRTQPKYSFRAPLVILTPKSLLRHPRCVSPVEDFTKGTFKEVLDDNEANPDKVQRVILCSGKIYYELLEKREQEERNDIALIRLEQIYPMPLEPLKEITKKYGKANEWYWVQEEPENAGALSYMYRNFDLKPLHFISRPESATPATGSYKLHKSEQEEILQNAFAKAPK